MKNAAKTPTKSFVKTLAKSATESPANGSTRRPEKPATPAKTQAAKQIAKADPRPRIYRIAFGSVYPLCVQKVEKKGRTKADVDTVIRWLTGYGDADLERVVRDGVDLETFFAEAPRRNPNAALITGVVVRSAAAPRTPAAQEPERRAHHRRRMRRPRRGNRRSPHAQNPLARRARRRARQGKEDGEHPAPVSHSRGEGLNGHERCDPVEHWAAHGSAAR